MPKSSAKPRPKIGQECWTVEWILSADVPQKFKDDPDRDLTDVYQWERSRSFPNKGLAETFGKTLRGLFFGCYDIKHMRWGVEYPECGAEWLLVDNVEHEEATEGGAA